MDHLGGLLNRRQTATAKGAEQIVDLKGTKGLEVKLNKRTYTLSRGRVPTTVSPRGRYTLVAGGTGYFPQELPFTVGTKSPCLSPLIPSALSGLLGRIGQS